MNSLNPGLVRRPEFISPLQNAADTAVFICVGCAGQNHVQWPCARSWGIYLILLNFLFYISRMGSILPTPYSYWDHKSSKKAPKK